MSATSRGVSVHTQVRVLTHVKHLGGMCNTGCTCVSSVRRCVPQACGKSWGLSSPAHALAGVRPSEPAGSPHTLCLLLSSFFPRGAHGEALGRQSLDRPPPPAAPTPSCGAEAGESGAARGPQERPCSVPTAARSPRRTGSRAATAPPGFPRGCRRCLGPTPSPPQGSFSLGVRPAPSRNWGLWVRAGGLQGWRPHAPNELGGVAVSSALGSESGPAPASFLLQPPGSQERGLSGQKRPSFCRQDR